MLKHLLFVFISAVLVTVGWLPTVVAQETEPLPIPAGPYQVGATFRQWTDDSREEPFTADPDDRRTLSAWIYYPADVMDDTVPMPYVMDEATLPGIQYYVTDVFGKDFDAVWAEISQWQSHAYRDVPVVEVEQPVPVIVFTDLSGSPMASSLQSIDLASRGYVVIDVLHTYGFPFDGRIGTQAAPEEYGAIEGAMLVELAVEDNVAVLDWLEGVSASDSGDMLAGMIDLSHIGILGSLVGGGVARETTVRDSRIAAGAGQDGEFAWFEPVPFSQPFMYLYHTAQPIAYIRMTEGPVHFVSFRGLKKYSTYDWIFWPDVQRALLVLGRGTEPDRAYTLFTTFISAFFDKYLKGEEQPWLDDEMDAFPELTKFGSFNTD